jgi:hypothetical protein
MSNCQHCGRLKASNRAGMCEDCCREYRRVYWSDRYQLMDEATKEIRRVRAREWQRNKRQSA